MVEGHAEGEVCACECVCVEADIPSGQVMEVKQGRDRGEERRARQRRETVAGLSSAGTKKMNSDELLRAERELESPWRTGQRLCASIHITVTCVLLMNDRKRLNDIWQYSCTRAEQVF